VLVPVLYVRACCCTSYHQQRPYSRLFLALGTVLWQLMPLHVQGGCTAALVCVQPPDVPLLHVSRDLIFQHCDPSPVFACLARGNPVLALYRVMYAGAGVRQLKAAFILGSCTTFCKLHADA
jgi:hypothetical protein